MKWKIFLLGVVTGWLIEWLIDVFYWRRLSDERQHRLEQAETASRAVAGRIRAYEERLSAAQAELAQASTELGGLRSRLQGKGAAQGAAEPPASAEGDVVAVDEGGEAADDLRRIEGIGPKIAGILQSEGITTFAGLAATPPERLQAILDAAGPRYRLADPATWPEQAARAAAGDAEGLARLQGSLKGGKEVD